MATNLEKKNQHMYAPWEATFAAFHENICNIEATFAA
jgi:hypothetical protein